MALLLALLLGAPPARAADAPGRAQKRTIEQITSIFESGTPDFLYGYIEDIGDGAGVTCGRLGFTSTELRLLVGRYAAKRPAAPLARYIPCLDRMGAGIMKDYSCLFPSLSAEQLAKPEFKVVGGLIGRVDFGKAWTDAAADPVMRKVQDDYSEEAYYRPAIALAGSLGLRTALGAAFVYDACVQMGCDSKLYAAVARTFAASHGGRAEPRGLDEEARWLALYVPERKAELSVSPAGAATVSRVDALAQLLAARNFELALPLQFDYSGVHFALPAEKGRGGAPR